jgi:TetR/AcrR family transcriptional regulator
VARPRAADYGEKRGALLHQAAVLFAENGYDRTSMSDIAKTLGVSKALFYHYYRSKDDLLFDIIRTHLQILTEVTQTAALSLEPAEVRLSSTIKAILDCYRDADAEHRVQISDMKRLSHAQQTELKAMERGLVTILSDIVASLAPALSAAKARVLTMAMFGALNWTFMWFRENGPVSRDSYADILTHMFLSGINRIEAGDSAA